MKHRSRSRARRARLASGVVAALGAVAFACAAQAPPPATAPGAASSSYYCPVDGQVLPAPALYGEWQLQIDGGPPPHSATLQLDAHPDYAGVRGRIHFADGSQAQLAGDIGDDGLLTIDESADGRSISASWQARLQAGSCARAFEGRRRTADEDIDAPGHPFVLRRAPPPATLPPP